MPGFGCTLNHPRLYPKDYTVNLGGGLYRLPGDGERALLHT
jgi:hypothetical protein